MSERHKTCFVDGCDNPVYPQDEVDVGVGTITSTEVPICEQCHTSEDPAIKIQIKELEEGGWLSF